MPKRAPKTLRPTDRGLTHAYIGDGKGKTTAAVGTAVRAAGYTWKICFLQFMKESKWPSGERNSLRKLGVEIHVMGEGWYKILNDQKAEEQHKGAALHALKVAREKVMSGEYQLVILDELGSAVEEKLLDKKPVFDFFTDRAKDARAKMTHVIWTGHQRIPWMLKFADLVTEMKMIKHPYYQGIIATRGLDY